MIILVSKFDVIFDKIDLKGKKKIAFIPNAKDKHVDKSGLEKTRLFFKQKGFIVNDVNLNDFKNQDLYKEFLKYEIIYIAGGNCFVLLEKIRKSGFDKIITNLLNKGIIIIGESAGACVMGKSIEPIKLIDDFKASKLKNYEGLGFVNFVFIPHYKNPKYDMDITKIEHEYRKKFKLTKFTDYECVILENSNIRKI